jgi:hypothetical protein
MKQYKMNDYLHRNGEDRKNLESGAKSFLKESYIGSISLAFIPRFPPFEKVIKKIWG